MTQELRKLATDALAAANGERMHTDGSQSMARERALVYYTKAVTPDAIISLLDRLEKAERLLFELREAAAAVVSNEEHAFSGGMRKYAEGSQTWQVYEDLRIAMEASK